MRIPYGPVRFLNRRRLLFTFLAWDLLWSVPSRLWGLFGPDAKSALLALAQATVVGALAYFVARSRRPGQALWRSVLMTAGGGLAAAVVAGPALVASLGGVSFRGFGFLELVPVCLLVGAAFIATLWTYGLVRYALRAKNDESAEALDRLVVASFLWILAPHLLRLSVGMALHALSPESSVVPYEWRDLPSMSVLALLAALAIRRIRMRRGWLRKVAAGEHSRWRVVALKEVADPHVHLPAMSADEEASGVLVYLDDDVSEPYREATRRTAVALVSR